MSRQSKNKSKAIKSKSSKGASKGNHFAEKDFKSKFPGDQPAPNWVRPTGARGWFNTKDISKDLRDVSKDKALAKKQDLSWCSRSSPRN